MIDFHDARAILAAHLRPDEYVFPGAYEDAEAYLFGYGYDEHIVAIGPGPALVDKRTGEVTFLGSIEQLNRRSRMTPVEDLVTECFRAPTDDE